MRRGIGFTNCRHRSDKFESGAGHDEGAIGLVIADLHALRHREGMGKLAFPPQGVGTPVLLVERCAGGFESQRLKARLIVGSLRYAWRHTLIRISYFRSRSAATKRAKTTEITPFMVKKAAFRRDRFPGLTRECS